MHAGAVKQGGEYRMRREERTQMRSEIAVRTVSMEKATQGENAEEPVRRD